MVVESDVGETDVQSWLVNSGCSFQVTATTFLVQVLWDTLF